MASLDVRSAAETIGSADFLMTAAAVVIGALVAQMGVTLARQNVYDLQLFPGDDAVYAAAIAFLLVLAGQATGAEEHLNNAALGAGAAGVRVVLAENGLV